MTFTGVVAIAGGAVLLLLGLLWLLANRAGVRSLATVILGADGRTSTSKTFVLLWTLLVSWAMISLLIAGEFVPAHSCLLHPQHRQLVTACNGHPLALLQVSWHNLLRAPLSGTYLILLGIPGAAAVGAKGITQSTVNGNGFKPPKPTPIRGKAKAGEPVPPVAPPRLQRVTEIFSADDGTTDIGDLQYLIFNLITAVYFVTQFLHPNGHGLPAIPNTLVGLTGISASVYVGKKAVSQSQPAVTGVFPLPLHDGEHFTIIGTGLTAVAGSPTEAHPQATIDGMAVTIVNDSGPNIVAVAPPNVSIAGAPLVRRLRVRNPYDGITADFDVQCQ